MDNIIKATGHGQTECFECKKNGKFSLTWTSFLYHINNNNFKNYYCWECANKLVKGVKI